MALVLTPVAGNGRMTTAARVECTRCPSSLVIRGRFSALALRTLVTRTERGHVCSAKS